eukprot:9447626-Alexandrium_andersonii.AAC.1
MLQALWIAGDVASLAAHLGVATDDPGPERRCVFSAGRMWGFRKDQGLLVRLADFSRGACNRRRRGGRT